MIVSLPLKLHTQLVFRNAAILSRHDRDLAHLKSGHSRPTEEKQAEQEY
ncbi:hypothetical protein [Vibrio neptunius]|uniref:Uncharacterized protein n=1 Tax=Vibrio neptunius TaxID=170651 RepID=A0ABS3A2B4_9VIBR|nr:hypothetical protein [Vibrio neptunius]MBN3493835.1 hypothetical protein [Vibrio neptunius]MBN3516342.1 hypothetical protein [Vibrio neptunius]MBN3550505.1 hypothetical protein [Vibrio neptunius]MBN3578636.1 hypothetical protein [Vibrio neptunius]MCH9872301.1 hypothetical protein [Vibrio neptunius]